MSTHVLHLLVMVILVCEVFCDSGCSGEKHFNYLTSPHWRLAFRGTPNINKTIYDAYTTNQTTDVDPACRDPTDSSCSQHYRDNDALTTWANIDEVAFAIYKRGHIVHYILFDGKGSTYMNWFTGKRVHETSWVDLKTETTKNFFSIKGQGAPNSVHTIRRFYINRNYGGCKADAGWFAAIDLPRSCPDNCTWERNSGSFPLFLYAKSDNNINWTTGDVGRADAIAVFLKYLE